MSDAELLAEIVRETQTYLDGAYTKDEHSDKITLLLVEHKKIS
jgi:hypothetical protein